MFFSATAEHEDQHNSYEQRVAGADDDRADVGARLRVDGGHDKEGEQRHEAAALAAAFAEAPRQQRRANARRAADGAFKEQEEEERSEHERVEGEKSAT